MKLVEYYIQNIYDIFVLTRKFFCGKYVVHLSQQWKHVYYECYYITVMDRLWICLSQKCWQAMNTLIHHIRNIIYMKWSEPHCMMVKYRSQHAQVNVILGWHRSWIQNWILFLSEILTCYYVCMQNYKMWDWVDLTE